MHIAVEPSPMRSTPARSRRFTAASRVLRGLLNQRAGGSPVPNGAVSRLGSASGMTPHTTTGGRSARGWPVSIVPPVNARVDEHGVGGTAPLARP